MDENKTVPAPAASNAPAANSSGKKSNTALIVVIVLVVVIGLVAAGSYFAYKYIKNKVKTAVNEVSTTTSTGGTVSGSLTDNYSDSKDLTPSTDFAVGINNDAKPVFASLFGGAKLNIVSSEQDSASLYYLTKNSVAVGDGDKVSAELVKKGYSQDSLTNSGDGFVLYMTKGNISLFVTSSDSYNISVVASQITE